MLNLLSIHAHIGKNSLINCLSSSATLGTNLYPFYWTISSANNSKILLFCDFATSGGCLYGFRVLMIQFYYFLGNVTIFHYFLSLTVFTWMIFVVTLMVLSPFEKQFCLFPQQISSLNHLVVPRNDALHVTTSDLVFHICYLC